MRRLDNHRGDTEGQALRSAIAYDQQSADRVRGISNVRSGPTQTSAIQKQRRTSCPWSGRCRVWPCRRWRLQHGVEERFVSSYVRESGLVTQRSFTRLSSERGASSRQRRFELPVPLRQQRAVRCCRPMLTDEEHAFPPVARRPIVTADRPDPRPAQDTPPHATAAQKDDEDVPRSVRDRAWTPSSACCSRRETLAMVMLLVGEEWRGGAARRCS